MVRFSLDGLILAHVKFGDQSFVLENTPKFYFYFIQVVFLAFLVVLKETPEAVFIGLLLVLTVITKLGYVIVENYMKSKLTIF